MRTAHRLVLVSLAALLLASLPARADEAPRPLGAVKLVPTLMLPASVGVEWFAWDGGSVELDVGAGLGGAGGAFSVRKRFCWGCDAGVGFALGVGPELVLIPFEVAPRFEGVLGVVVEPAVVFRFGATAGVLVGLKGALGASSGRGGDGKAMPVTPAMNVGFTLGLQL